MTRTARDYGGVTRDGQIRGNTDRGHCGACIPRSALTAGLLVDHAKAVRIPLLIILFGVILTFWVDQIWELFLLLVLPNSGVASSVGIAARTGALAMAGCLGFAVWHTAPRTVYRFDIPTIPTLSDAKAEGLREWGFCPLPAR